MPPTCALLVPSSNYKMIFRYIGEKPVPMHRFILLWQNITLSVSFIGATILGFIGEAAASDVRPLSDLRNL